jgi:hypothetical protein
MIEGPVRGVLRGEGKFVNKAYFFKGNQYWRYDLSKDYGEVDYPQPLTAWKLPGDFSKGIDAVLPGEGEHAGKAFFFRGPLWVSYDWVSGAVSAPAPLARWGRVGVFPFPDGIDAALPGSGKYAGNAYFFKESKYAKYSWKDDRNYAADQPISAWNLGDRFASDITACLNYTEVVERAGKDGARSKPIAYFFKGNEYVKYDWDSNRRRDGYPMLIPAGWPSGCAVWASHAQAPTNVSRDDPRLDAGKARIAYPSGDLRGQAGWQISVEFSDLNELANKLTKLIIPTYYGDDRAGEAVVPPGRITRLGINAHGEPGNFHVNGPSAWFDRFNEQSINDMQILQNHRRRTVINRATGELGDPEAPGVTDSLDRIRPMLAPAAPVLLLGCQAGQGTSGAFLLTALSKRNTYDGQLHLVFEGHPVTAFTSIGYAGGQRQIRPSAGFYETGMRDTNFLTASRSRGGGDTREEDARVARYWADLEAWPWASESSPRAKTALNGTIIRTPSEDSST